MNAPHLVIKDAAFFNIGLLILAVFSDSADRRDFAEQPLHIRLRLVEFRNGATSNSMLSDPKQ